MLGASRVLLLELIASQFVCALSLRIRQTRSCYLRSLAHCMSSSIRASCSWRDVLFAGLSSFCQADLYMHHIRSSTLAPLANAAVISLPFSWLKRPFCTLYPPIHVVIFFGREIIARPRLTQSNALIVLSIVFFRQLIFCMPVQWLLWHQRTCWNDEISPYHTSRLNYRTSF